jgi:subtilisin-like proprotein convertase family protein
MLRSSGSAHARPQAERWLQTWPVVLGSLVVLVAGVMPAAGAVTKVFEVTGADQDLPTDSTQTFFGDVSEEPGQIGNLTVSFRMDHENIGDLLVQLRGPDETLVTLMETPGRTSDGDLPSPFGDVTASETGSTSDGTEGSAAEFSSQASNEVTFDDTLTGANAQTISDFVFENESASNDGDIISGTFESTDRDSTTGLKLFDNQSYNGRWSLIVQDKGDPEATPSNSLSQWSLSALLVPSPSALSVGLWLLASLGIARPRRAIRGV